MPTRAEIARLCEELGRTTTQRLLGENAYTDIAWVPGGDVDGRHPRPARRPRAPCGRARRQGATAGGPTPGHGDRPEHRRGWRVADGGARRDGGLSEALASVGGDAGSGVRGVARLLADSAAIALERPDPDRTCWSRLHATGTPWRRRGWLPSTALTSAPWMEAASLQELLATDPDDAEREPVTLGPDQRDGELPTQDLSERRRHPAPHPAGGRRVRRPGADPAEGRDRGRGPGVVVVAARRRGLAGGGQRLSTARLDALAAPCGWSRQHRHAGLAQRRAAGHRENTVDQPVTVRSTSSRSRAGWWSTRQTTETLPCARTAGRSRVPVRGVGNGDTSVRVQLRSRGGASLGCR